MRRTSSWSSCLADEIAHRFLDQRVVLRGGGVRAHEFDDRQLRRAGAARSEVVAIVRFAQRQLRERRRRTARRFFAGTQRLRHAAEIGRGKTSERRIEHDVGRQQLLALLERATADQDREGLVGHFERRSQLIAQVQREAHVDHDQHVDAHRTRRVDRQILDQAAVDEQPALALRGREHARRRHARAHRRDEVAGIHHDRLAGFEIRRDGAKRNRQTVEALDLRDRQRRIAQHLFELLPLHQAGRQHEPRLLHAEREAHQEVALVLLAAEAELLARRAIAKRVLPVQRANQRLDLGARHAGGIQAADDRAHARTGDRVDRHAHLVQYFQHADVRRAACTAAAEHQADARPLTFGSMRSLGEQEQAEGTTGALSLEAVSSASNSSSSCDRENGG